MSSKNIKDHIAHFHVLSAGDAMSGGLLKNISKNFTRAISDVAKKIQKGEGEPALAEALRSKQTLAKKMDAIQSGAGIDENLKWLATLANVAKTFN